MPTKKAYWDDPFATALETRGAEASTWEGKPSLVLSETLFYPEGGGQLGDVGTLRVGDETVNVVDTQIDDAGAIHHVVERAIATSAGATVAGSIDVSRRRDAMAHHTAQHMLSRALLDEARAATASARIGLGTCTIDVERESIPDAELHRAEDRVNDAIRADLAIRALFPTAEELARLDLRRAPKVSAGVRIIDIDGFDLTPCGGTHCTRTGQIGVVRVAHVERYKGKLRVGFHAATRAISDARAKEAVLGALAKKLTCGVLDVGAAVGKLQNDLKERTDALATARGELFELLAKNVLAEHPPDPSGATLVRVARVGAGTDVASLRTLAARLAGARGDVFAVCTAEDGDGLLVVVQRGASTAVDCGAWLKSLAAKTGGRGGGRPERAEGRLPNDAATEALLRII